MGTVTFTPSHVPSCNEKAGMVELTRSRKLDMELHLCTFYMCNYNILITVRVQDLLCLPLVRLFQNIFIAFLKLKFCIDS